MLLHTINAKWMYTRVDAWKLHNNSIVKVKIKNYYNDIICNWIKRLNFYMTVILGITIIISVKVKR